MKQVTRDSSASLRHMVDQIDQVNHAPPAARRDAQRSPQRSWRGLSVSLGLLLSVMLGGGEAITGGVLQRVELISEASAQERAQPGVGQQRGAKRIKRAQPVKRAKRNRISKRKRASDRNASPTTFEKPRAIIYADTEILDIRREKDQPWSVGLWRKGKLITRYPCKNQRCTFKIPKAELTDLLNRWNLETGGRAEKPASEAQRALLQAGAPWEMRAQSPVTPLRTFPDGVWLGWGPQGAGDPLNTIVVEQIRINQPLITNDKLLVTREPVKVYLNHPELIKSVSCLGAECVLSRRSIRFFAINRRRGRIRVRFTLKSQVKSLEAGRWSQRQQRWLSVQRCVIVTPEIPLLANIERHSMVIAIARGCGAGDVNHLRVETKPNHDVTINELLANVDPHWRFFELLFDRVSKRTMLFAQIFKDQGQAVLLGAVKIPITKHGIPKMIRLKLKQLGSIEFIPTNQPAQLDIGFDTLSNHELNAYHSIVPKSLFGYYQIKPREHQGALPSYVINALPEAAGNVPIMFSYRPKFDGPFKPLNSIALELASFPSKGRFKIRPLKTPIELTRRKRELKDDQESIVVVQCADREGRPLPITKGLVALIPYESRYSCQVIIHRERIPIEVGTQHIQISMRRDQLSTRRIPDYKRLVTVKNAPTPLIISIPIPKAIEFERVEIAVGHAYGSARYDFSPQHDLGDEARYELVLGDRNWSISVSTSMPTGLFRYGLTPEDRTAVSLSAGGLSRLLWLYSEGRPFPLGLEFGALVTGINDDPHLSLVGGIGLSVPVLNANTPFEASFNLHAWFEYAPSRVESGSTPWSFLFGPSFAVGKFSTQL